MTSMMLSFLRAHWHHQINARHISNQFQSSRFRLYKYPFRPLDMFGAERVNNRPTVIVHWQSKHYQMHSMMLRSRAWHRTGHLKSRQTGIIQIRWSIRQGLEHSVSPPIFIIKAKVDRRRLLTYWKALLFHLFQINVRPAVHSLLGERCGIFSHLFWLTFSITSDDNAHILLIENHVEASANYFRVSSHRAINCSETRRKCCTFEAIV